MSCGKMDSAPDTGPIAGRKLDFAAIKHLGYKALGWDGQTGRPLASTLEDLGLKELTKELP